jgi:hypothetical protein
MPRCPNVDLVREVRCQLCGSAFTCERRTGCWCSAVNASKGSRARLRLTADDCVCPVCLAADTQEDGVATTERRKMNS